MNGLRRVNQFVCILVMMLSFDVVSASAVKALSAAPGKAITLKLSPLYSTIIKLQGIKKISSIHCGDASAWEILKPMDSSNSIVIKPMSEQSKTDLIIRADRQDFLFKIESRPLFNVDPLLFVTVSASKKTIAFAEKPASVNPVSHYCYRGDPLLRPSWAYDDSQATYLHWSKYSAVPAIYKVTSDHQSKYMVNFRVHSNVFRVPVVSDQWLLKKGKRKGWLIYFDADSRRCDG